MSNQLICSTTNIPEIIKHIRDLKKLSQQRLGEKVSISNKTVSSYEASKINPSLNNFIKIVEACGYNLELKEKLLFPAPKKKEYQ